MFNDKLKRSILSGLHGHFFKVDNREFKDFNIIKLLLNEED